MLPLSGKKIPQAQPKSFQCERATDAAQMAYYYNCCLRGCFCFYLLLRSVHFLHSLYCWFGKKFDRVNDRYDESMNGAACGAIKSHNLPPLRRVSGSSNQV